MTRMHITLEISLIISSKWLESTLKRNQFMNELFINSLINDIGWRNNKEENSWSYAWRFYHKRLMMVQESSITIQDMIWRIEINQRNCAFEKGFSCSYKYHSGHTKWRKHLHLMVLKGNKNITIIIILLSTNSFCENLFHENELRTFWQIRWKWNSTSKVNKSAQCVSMAGYVLINVYWAIRKALSPFEKESPLLSHG